MIGFVSGGKQKRDMKKIIVFLLTVFAAAACLRQTPVSAATEFSDGVYTFSKTEYGTAVITDCTLTDEEIKVPYYVLDYPVAGIGGYAFFSNSFIRKVELPSGVLSIGEFSFANNPGLESVTIPKRCASIADNAFWNSPNVTIHCRYDSAAFSYACDNNIPCVLLDQGVMGDVNGDGCIDISDVTAVQRYVAELEPLDGIHLLAANVNQDSEVDIIDATDLQKFLAEYALPYPIGEPIIRSIQK